MTALTIIEGFSPDCGGDKEPTHIMVEPSIHIFHDLSAEGGCQDFVVDAEMDSVERAIGPRTLRRIRAEFDRAKRSRGSSRYWRFAIDGDGNVVERA